MKVGILGGGQLGRMLALAGYPIGIDCWVLTPDENPPAGVAAHVIAGDYEDTPSLKELASAVDVVTYEFENVPSKTAQTLAASVPARPGPKALEVAQDRLVEKEALQAAGIPTAPFLPVNNAQELAAAVTEIGPPLILKTRRFGYDGKGQQHIEGSADTDMAWRAISEQPSVAEQRIAFKRELSVIAVRSTTGAEAFYPLVENRHDRGILTESRAPAPNTSPELVDKAQGYARALLHSLDYVGVLALELFELEDGSLLANEFAPRVHNSGHWSIEGADTSQFENHLRAITGLPMGSTAARGHSVMLNLIGALPDRNELLAVPGLHLHDYGKAPRAGRKVGHVTLCENSTERLATRLEQARAVIAAAGQAAPQLGEPAGMIGGRG